MILVGSGALVWRAAAHAADAGVDVDLVLHPQGEEVPAFAAGIDHLATVDVNLLADVIDEASTDGIICSTGNPFLFRAPVLEMGLTIVNVHGAPLPGYRGLPVVAGAFALLRGETVFGATLHRVDAGIDTGAVIDRHTFPLRDEVTLEELTLTVTEACHALFVDNLSDLGREPADAVSSRSGEYFGRARLPELAAQADHPRYARATHLGVMAEFYPEEARVFSAARLSYRPSFSSSAS
ncbi:formyltransferase family protein [Microbacterium sp. VKM Ac-2923]|uniref:formyltransferase family protein n=1 Tax=Microbacterium sp. VKM Ac-2923 TaxID=2929476 RepID=UPI001FB47B57|nr:formyltransferase family protein [Microbacterium sp. VKM Ac-2923]MCJ1708513.1 hypothetical protein [Microbacterium sp. VKM Ac-2923]